ncbi:hypothetical protein MTP99_012850 [Tenebrio molitor]|jgi:hypothetical protein|uniref:Uncharacterized protein n=1 Tax=Tenebrio molitor TaxID=7067 RepID=A0A8J6HQH6_TENMO|nr:hypothetical protein GEV33_004259 [Tenebrio molitor]KAJ3631741.1 hypothetical protein MTP99_012850 [Tenebrio molitor]
MAASSMVVQPVVQLLVPVFTLRELSILEPPAKGTVFQVVAVQVVEAVAVTEEDTGDIMQEVVDSAREDLVVTATDTVSTVD